METAAVMIDGTVGPVRLLDGYRLEFAAAAKVDKQAIAEQARMTEELKRQTGQLEQVIQSLNSVTTELREHQDSIFSAHKQEIAKLSVEIARRVLAQKVSEGDYKIEEIVAEAVSHLSGGKDVVVYVNPEDLAACKQALSEGDSELPAGLRFSADSSLGRAECRVESEKGMVESMIESHLEQIARALKQAG